MIYTDIGNITVSMTRHVSQRFSFVKQINLDVSLKHNSDAHSQSGGWAGWGRCPFSRLEEGSLPSFTPCLTFSVFYCFLIVKGCALFCHPLKCGSLEMGHPFLKKKS